MYVLRGDITISGTDRSGLPDGTTTMIFPADRCIWAQSYNQTTSEYTISDAYFLPLTHSAGTAADDIGSFYPLANAQLGYIGKSGRFVEIAS